MYCEFYGFREKPFNITPNPRFMFLSKNHREAFAHLLYGIDNHAGFIELTGEVGTGKTTVLRTLFEQLDERGHRTALIFNPCLSALELMRSINREFAIPCEGLSSAELLDTLNGFLLSENSAGRTVVLVIDEAQNLEPKVLEQVRLISNLETKTDKLIQIVLAGQPELAVMLNRPELRQIAQRITVSYHLTPLDFEDTKSYIEYRLEIAGDWRAAVFSPMALKRVYRYTGGVPRLINIVCDRALLMGYTQDSRDISARLVQAAIGEIRQENGRTRKVRPFLLWLLIPAALLGIITAALRFNPFRDLTGIDRARSVNADVRKSSAVSPVTLAGELAKTSEAESAVSAFNALARRWNVAPVTTFPRTGTARELDKASSGRGLELVRFNGSLGLLIRIGYPAILECTLPGIEGKRYLALTGTDLDRYLITPALAGQSSLSSRELESLWSGVAYIPWKNFLNIPALITRRAYGEDAARLQQLLLNARVYNGKPGRMKDGSSIAAVKRFQTANGITPDGKPGIRTLMLLYRAGGRYPVPTLDNPGGSRKP
jgi:general secretion pathway protein A